VKRQKIKQALKHVPEPEGPDEQLTSRRQELVGETEPIIWLIPSFTPFTKSKCPTHVLSNNKLRNIKFFEVSFHPKINIFLINFRYLHS